MGFGEGGGGLGRIVETNVMNLRSEGFGGW